MGFDKGVNYTFGLAAICILLTLVAIGAQASEEMPPQPLPVAADAAAMAADPAQSLIRRQLDAIKSRDAEMVWSLTTETFHEKFGTARDFLSHLRFQLRPLYNHGAIEFIGQYGEQDSLVQKVRIEDRYGEPVTVIYRLRQERGEWRIDSFAVLPHEAEPI